MSITLKRFLSKIRCYLQQYFR